MLGASVRRFATSAIRRSHYEEGPGKVTARRGWPVTQRRRALPGPEACGSQAPQRGAALPGQGPGRVGGRGRRLSYVKRAPGRFQVLPLGDWPVLPPHPRPRNRGFPFP
ncbi:unnamed protein product [Lepidochelys kempii]